MRIGVLLHAATVRPEQWPPLDAHLAHHLPQHGAHHLPQHAAERVDLVLVRAHADWSSPDLAGWLPVLRDHNIELRHQFHAPAVQDPAMIALTIDALDLAATARLDAIVLAGDVSSALPLLNRLRQEGLHVVVAGPPHTPPDIRAGCHMFVELCSLAAEHPAHPEHPGRHRADGP